MSESKRGAHERPPHSYPGGFLPLALLVNVVVWSLVALTPPSRVPVSATPAVAPVTLVPVASARLVPAPRPRTRVGVVRAHVESAAQPPALRRRPAPTTPAGEVALIHRFFPKSQWTNAVHVAACESHFHYWERATDSNGTHDWGVFQLNDGGTLQETLRLTGQNPANLNLALNPVWNVRAAAALYRRDAWHQWHCAEELNLW